MNYSSMKFSDLFDLKSDFGGDVDLKFFLRKFG
jgi:hypothetical protein